MTVSVGVATYPSEKVDSPGALIREADRALYRACDAGSDAAQLGELARSAGDAALPPEQIDARLQPLVDRGLLVKEGSRYLALAIPLGDYRPPDAVMRRFYQLARRLGRSRAGSIVVPLDLPVSRRPTAASRRRPRVRARASARGARRVRPLRVPRFTLNQQGELVVR